MKKTLIFLLPVGLWIAWAQSPQTPMAGAQPAVKKEAFKNVAPVSKEVLKVKLPKAQEVHLDNGMTVLILEDHRLPQIFLSMDIRGGGGLLDPPEMKGLAGLSATLMREGTTTLSSKQIAEQVDLLAASIGGNAATTTMSSGFNMSGLSDNFDKWFALGVDVFLHPSFPADEWAKLKQRTLLGLRQQRTNPGFLASERFNKLVFGDHPLSAIAATPATVEAITPEAMKKWHDERLAPQNTILGIVGDITPAEVLPKLKTAFAGWKKSDYKPVQPPNAPPNPELHVAIVNRPGSVQTNIVMGNVGIDRRSPDYFAMNVMNQVLGAGSSARLFNNLREDKGYTYGAYSNFSAGMLPGPWQASSEVRTDVTEGAMREFFNELRRIREEKVPAGELEEKKRLVVASFALSLESPATLLNYAITRKDYNLPEDYWDTYPEKISAVTADDVQRVAQKYLTLDHIQIVAVGDATKIKPVMEKYGKVTVYDVNGQVVE
ncbi:MAG TPA: pitrilysin family protein [Bryobacteraceae bacterium]|nr:pitrilysin family protein [Bryobacteraceae bacterium]